MNVTTIKQFSERLRKNKLSMDKKSIVSSKKTSILRASLYQFFLSFLSKSYPWAKRQICP